MQYLFVELMLGSAFLYTATSHQVEFSGLSPMLIRDWVIIVFLTAIFIYDQQYGEILDRFTLAPAVALFAANVWYQWFTWGNMALAAAAASGFFWLQYLISRGKWIGVGDIHLGAFMGIVLSWPLILVAVLIAYVLGAIISLGLVFSNQKILSHKISFGPYLTVSTFITMYWGNQIFNWYVGLFRL